MKLIRLVLIDDNVYTVNADHILYMSLASSPDGGLATRIVMSEERVLHAKETPQLIADRLGVTIR